MITKLMKKLKHFLGLDYYVSDLDQFLSAYAKAHPQLSAAQAQEVDKYKRIYHARDEAQQKKPEPQLWDQF
jgi:hypothetical protein